MKDFDFYSRHAIFEIPRATIATTNMANMTVRARLRRAVSSKKREAAVRTVSSGKMNMVMMKVSLKRSLASCDAMKVN